MRTKIINVKDDYKFNSKMIMIEDILKPGDLFAATNGFFKYIRKERMYLHTYYYTISEIFELDSKNELPILMYVGERNNTFYKDHTFLLGGDKCFIYDDDFRMCFPITITILNSQK